MSEELMIYLRELRKYVPYLLLLLFAGCDTDCNEPVTPDGGVSYLKIKKIEPSSINASGGEFRIYGSAGFFDGNRLVELRIIREPNGQNDSCLAWVETQFTGANNNQLEYIHNTSLLYDGCGEPNYRYWVKLRDLSYPDSGLHYEMPFDWGDPNFTTKHAYIETAQMQSIGGSIQSNTRNSITSTFNDNIVRVTTHYSSLYGINTNVDFTATSIGELLSMLDSFAVSYKEEPYSTYPYYLIFARKVNYPGGDNTVGLSWSERIGIGYNWSYIFVATIDSLKPSPPYVRQSIYNQTGNHELIHQLGNATNSDTAWNTDHYWHTGQDSAKCVLHYGIQFDNEEYQTLTSTWKICDRHITALRNFLPTTIAGVQLDYPQLPHVKSYPECNYKIEMSLDKSEYKKYEPVVAKFTIINYDAKPFNIYNLFNPELRETNIMISDDLGNKWSTNKTIVDPNILLGNPNYIIGSGDSLIISMPINNWAVEYKDTVAIRPKSLYNMWYFKQFGYFPPNRKYKAYLYFSDKNAEFYGCDLESNEVEFNVIDLTIEDEELMRLYMGKMRNFQYETLSEVISKFPKNVFTEHINAEYLSSKWFWKESAGIENDYELFFNNYPNSYYLYNRVFVLPYFRKLVKDNVDREKAYRLISNDNVKKSIKWYLK